jgi:general stress protein 26
MTREHLDTLVREFDTAMLVTCTADGQMHARPMAIAQIDDAGRLWFVTADDTPKVQEIASQSAVTLTMQGRLTYVALTGTAETVVDRERIRELWQDSWRVWFPDGPNSPNLVMLRVEPTHGAFWDYRGSIGVRFLWEAVKAYARGDRLDRASSERRHGELDL